MVTVIKRGSSVSKIRELMEKHSKKRKIKLKLGKYCGVIKLTEDPLEVQKKLRDEWE